MRGARRHHLALAKDVVERIVLAEAHDMPPGGVGDQIALVAQAALAAARWSIAPFQQRQGADAIFDVSHGHRAPLAFKAVAALVGDADAAHADGRRRDAGDLAAVEAELSTRFCGFSVAYGCDCSAV